MFFVRILAAAASVAMLAACTATLPVVERDGAYAQAFGSTSLEIFNNNGGDPILFLSSADEVKRKKLQVRIIGLCFSSCALFADKARPNVCVTKNASFGLHKMTTLTSQEISWTQNGVKDRVAFTLKSESDPPMSPDIAGWVEEHGGFPSKGFLFLSGKEELTKFWPLCDE